MKNIYMHLTNYAINKENENYENNEGVDKDDVGSKRSMQQVLLGIEDDERFGEEAKEKLE